MDNPFSSVRHRCGRSRHWLIGLCAVAPLALAPSASAVSEPSLINGQKKSYGYSWQQELQLGAQSDKEVTESMGVYDDPKVQQYVDAVGQRVLQQSNFNNPSAPAIYRNTRFTFRVIDSPIVNAFALPGGYVYVTRGLLTHVQNEAQLAVVLGHEIGHVAARHSSQQARRSQWTQLGVVAGAILGQKVLGDRAPDLAPSLMNMGTQAAEVFLLRYSREAENEADTLGVNYALRSGYAADQSARFFQSLQRLSAAEGQTIPTWKSTHPDPGDRAQHVTKMVATIPAETRSNVGEEEYLKHIEGMVVGDDPREGFVRNGVFYHPGLRFQLPVTPGWKLDNQRAAVMFGEPNGKAILGLKLAAGARARDAAQHFTQNAKVQVVASGDTQISGLPATVIIGQATTDDGAVGVWDAFIEYDGKVYSLLGYAPQAAFEQFRPTFESVAAGFSPLRDATVASVQPARLKLVRADRASPFASFVPTALPEGMSPDELAILNQVSLNDPINQGRILKIPEVPQNGLQAAPVAATNPGYPPTTPNPSSVPATTYPNGTGYPNQTYPAGPYPGGTSYPNGSYPNGTGAPASTTTYPSNYPNQPNSYPQSYPSGAPATYPASGGSYPSQPAGTYPPNSRYPSNYPSSYPANPNYPTDNRGYPNGANYPQAPSAYPNGTYPNTAPNSSANPYPNNGTSYPQFPQPPATNSQPAQPTYPR